MAIECKDVSYLYSEGSGFEVQALHQINLVIPEGEMIALIGQTVFREVDEQFAECDHIKAFIHRPYSIRRSYFSTSTSTLPSEEKLTAAASGGV